MPPGKIPLPEKIAHRKITPSKTTPRKIALQENCPLENPLSRKIPTWKIAFKFFVNIFCF